MSDSETLWTVVCQAPLFMRFSGQEYWSGLPCPPQGDLHYQEIKSDIAYVSALTGRFFTPRPPEKPRDSALTHDKYYYSS